MDPVFARSESGPLSQFAPWIPLACIVASVIFTLAHLILTAGRVRQTVSKLCGISLNSAPTDGSRVGYHSASHQSVTPSLRSLVDLRGGGVFLWNGSRFFACITLTALSALIAVLVDGADTAVEAPLPSFRLLAYHLLDSHGGRASSSGSVTSNKVEIAWCIFYAYASILAALTLTVKSRVRGFVRNHLVALLLIAMIIGTWRELFPLATFNIQLASSIVTRLVWSRLCLLAFAAVVVPICVPRSFTPVDPKEPGEPSPEQTAPLISLLFYDFVTPLIWKAYRSTKIEYEQLPPLADYDRATFLKQRGLHQLDPTNHPKPRHLLRGIMIVFWREYCVMTIMVFIKVLAELAGPVSIRFLLRYIEDGAQPGYTRPWVWILWLLLGPVVGAAAMQRYVFTTTGMIVRLEAMITQLLFEHSLRIRVADHGSEGASTKTEIHGKNSQREAGKEEHKAPNSNSVGKIYNLMSVDLNNISGDFLFVHLFAPLRIGLNVYFLYWILDWSALIGLLAMIALLFIPGKVTHLIHSTQVHWAKKTDTRVQFIVETLNVIRTIKLFAWERRIKTQSEKKREDELRWYRKRQLLGLITMDINYALPLIVMIVTFASHTLWFKKPLDASTVFSSITVFDLLRTQLRLLFLQIPATMQWAVSMKRTNDFLTKTELLDTYKAGSVAAASDGCLTPTSTIGFRNVDFTWGRSLPGTIPNSGQEFKLQIGGEVLFRPGKVNMVIGPTGCGKTSLLMALLGEMYTIHNGADSWVSLPREGGVAYAAQEAWIQNRTIRDNILFGSEYLDERYQKVLSQCALERDLELLEAGDQTEVGEKGVTISGGQKARISLARAIYSNANIIVLDDVLSALDVHTSWWIVDNCFRGDLVAGRTIIIVTHNVAMVSEVADFVVSIVDGRIASQGSVDDASRFRSKVKIEAEDQARENNGNQPEEGGPVERVPTPVIKKDGKLIVAEELAEGHVGWPALRLFLLAMGGVGFWVAYLAGFVLSNVTILLQTYWLGIWARAYDTSDNPKKVNVPFYLGVYGATCICGVILYSVAFIIHVSGSVRAARRIHDRLVASILGAPLYWINATPVGRIIARFTQDIRCVDGSLPNQMQSLVEMTIQLLSRFVAIIVVSPAFTFAGAILLVIGIWIGRVYIKAQLSVKRHMSNARSPMFSHFNAALAGIISIRAYGAEEQFRQEAQVRIDKYTRAARTFWNLNRWIAVRMDIIGAFFSAGLATYLVYFKTSISASDAGFSLNMAIALSGGILWWVRGLNEFEVQSNSLERIQDYLTIDQEPTAEPSKVPPAHWPSSGSIVVENLRARYTDDGPTVLHGLSFEIKSGERVGVVGRTGSGKSSLMLSLLRMIPTEGTVYYDGISTSSINLDALRSSITIIPQHPDLLAGTIRENLDPFEEHDDAELNSALAAAGLSISLDASAQKVSLGQRQMVALARAMVRRSKVVVLDEATAAIDYETDAAIQRSIRTEMRDRTLIIVAHRLQTVCDADKIMVLEEGKIVEFDSPVALLRKDRGAFKALVDGSADRDALYAMVKGH